MTQEELALCAITRAKELKDNMTKGEQFLWKKLLTHNKKYDTKWECQVPIVLDKEVKAQFNINKSFLVADFMETKHKVIIEVDGPLHNADTDHVRDTALQRCGFTTYRITSLDVWRNAVLKPFLDKIYNTEALSPWYA